MNSTYHVYFLQSSRDSKFYIGCTSKFPKERLKEHNSGMVRSTKYRRPFILVYYETFDNRHDASKREWHLKHSVGYQDKLDIIRKLDRRHAGS